jgi:hypothetical protein
MLRATENPQDTSYWYQKEKKAMSTENIPEEQQRKILQKQADKIHKHAQALFSGIDREILTHKFGHTTDDEVIAAIREEDANEFATRINHFQSEVIMGKFDEKHDRKKNPGRSFSPCVPNLEPANPKPRQR